MSTNKTKKFITFFSSLNLYLFAFITLFSLFITLVSNHHKKNINFKLKSNIKYVFLGHSHTSCAYNDSIITNSINLGEGGESYFYTYYKLKKILEDNKKRDLIYFIELSNNQLDSSVNRWIFKEPFISDKLPRYNSLINLKGYVLLMSHNPIDVSNALILSLNLNWKHINEEKNNLIETFGGFINKDTCLVDKKKKAVPQKKEFIDENQISNYSINYFQKIISELRCNKVKFFIIRTPIHKKSIFNYNEDLLFKIIKSNNLKSHFLDFGNLELNDSLFYDHEHLNSKGAEAYSKKINQQLFNIANSNFGYK